VDVLKYYVINNVIFTLGIFSKERNISGKFDEIILQRSHQVRQNATAAAKCEIEIQQINQFLKQTRRSMIKFTESYAHIVELS